MAATLTRVEAIATLEEGDAGLRALLEVLDQDELDRAATIGGGEWSAKDLVGHLESCERFALRTAEEWGRGEEPWIVQAAFSGPGSERVDALNADTFDRTRVMRAPEVMEAYRATHERLMDLLRVLPDERWDEERSIPSAPNRTQALGSMLGSVLGAPGRPFGHAFAHLPSLTDFVASLR